MSRNIRTEAIVLKTGRVGDIHKSVTLYTPELGIVNTIAHGVFKGKSKLGSGTEPFSRSTIYLYYEPVKQNYKISDLEIHDLFENVRTAIERFYAASLWAEVILKSHGGGEGYDRLYRLLDDSLTALNSDADPRLVEIQFLWRYIVFSGLQPDLGACGICGAEIPANQVIRHRREAGDFICARCANEREATLGTMSAGARAYLVHTAAMPVAQSVRVGLDAASKEALVRLLYRFVEDLVESPLRTLEAGVL